MYLLRSIRNPQKFLLSHVSGYVRASNASNWTARGPLLEGPHAQTTSAVPIVMQSCVMLFYDLPLGQLNQSALLLLSLNQNARQS